MDLFTIFCIALGLIILLDWFQRMGRRRGWWYGLCLSMVRQDRTRGRLDDGIKTISMFYFMSLITAEQKDKMLDEFSPVKG